jgi:prevent-host-death family protein
MRIALAENHSNPGTTQTFQFCANGLCCVEVSTISISDLKEQSAEQWLKSAEKGDLIVTSQGQPVAVLLPVSSESLKAVLSALRSVRAMVALVALQQTAEDNGTSGLSITDIDAEIDDVRHARHRK